MLGQRRGRWAKIKPTLGQRLVFSVILDGRKLNGQKLQQTPNPFPPTPTPGCGPNTGHYVSVNPLSAKPDNNRV